MKTLDIETLKKFLQISSEKLSGEWVLIGGTVLPLIGIDYRVTVDIDLIGLDEKQLIQSLQLMEIAEQLGLPVETINQAGAFFLYKIKNFKNHLIVLSKGKNATIYRPDLELYISLKINRISQSDLSDCLEYLKYTRNAQELFNKKAILDKIKAKSKNVDSSEKKQRLEVLFNSITKSK